MAELFQCIVSAVVFIIFLISFTCHSGACVMVPFCAILSHAMPLTVTNFPQTPHSFILGAPVAFQNFRQLALLGLHYIFTPRIFLKLIQIEFCCNLIKLLRRVTCHFSSHFCEKKMLY